MDARSARIEGLGLNDEGDFSHDLVVLLAAAPRFGQYVAYAQRGLAHDPCRTYCRGRIAFPAFETRHLRRSADDDFQRVAALLRMAREVEFRRSAAVAVIGHGFAVHAHFVIGRSPSQMEEYLPVGPCERYGELGRENVVFLRPVRQTGEVTGVARRGCGRFLRRGVGDHFAARQLAAVGRNILLRRQRAAREECYDRKNTPHIFAFLTFIFAVRRNEFPRSAPA